MKQRRYFLVLLGVLLFMLVTKVWLFNPPTMIAPGKAVVVTSQAKTFAAVSVTPPAQIESPKVSAVGAKADQIEATPADSDPQAHLDTAIRDIAKMKRDGDYIGFYKTYTPPDKFDPNFVTMSEINLPRAASDLASQNLKVQTSVQKALKDVRENEALTYEALEGQTPVYNEAGDEATYTALHRNINDNSTSAGPITFIKINDKWYIKQREATGPPVQTATSKWKRSSSP